MSKVWFMHFVPFIAGTYTFGLLQHRYDTATLRFTFSPLPEAKWIPIPPLSLDGETLSGKPAFAALPDA
nr:hypothetical protein [Enterobacter sp. Bisph1]